ncbi:MAG: DsbA family protein [Magnetococcales bacterium]|nr:DsbA family protein [Magnetococcales bacterium]
MPRRACLLSASALALVLLWTTTPLRAGEEPVARVGDWSLRLEEVDKALAGPLHDLHSQIHTLRMEKVQELMGDHLLALEAKAQGITSEKLLENRLNKVNPVSDADVETFLQQNREGLPDITPEIRAYAKNILNKRTRAMEHNALLSELSEKYNAQVRLTPPQEPRFEVLGPADLVRGPATAPVTIVEFSDFQCSYCQRVQKTLKTVLERFPDKVKLVYRHLPLPIHPQATKAAEAAQCAADQGGFWAYHDALFEHGGEMEPAYLKELAGKLKLDNKKFDHCLDSNQHAKRLAEDQAEANRLGVSGTPSFFINGIRKVGALPVAEFIQVIQAELGG